MKTSTPKITLKDKDGNVIKEYPLTQANDDWIRASRLQKQDTAKARKRLKEVQEEEMRAIPPGNPRNHR